jgi:hypothetical protein
LGHKLFDRECLGKWNIGHGGESNCWVKVHASSYTQLHITTSIFPHNKLGWISKCTSFWIFFF